MSSSRSPARYTCRFRLHVDDLDAVLGVVTQLQIHMSSGAMSGVIAPSIPAPWVGVAEPGLILRRMKPRSINRCIRNVAAARDGGTRLRERSMQPLAPAMILVPGHWSSGCSGNDRYPTRPLSAAPDGAMQVTVSGNNAGKTTSLLLSRASSTGASCTALAVGYHNHRWKD